MNQPIIFKQNSEQKNNSIFITDHQHYILDCWFNKIPNPFELNKNLHLIPGVVETGLFVQMATTIISGFEDGRIEARNV